MIKDPVSRFSEAMLEHGLQPGNVTFTDGGFHRFPINGNKNDKPGFYCLKKDGSDVYGCFGDWSRNLYVPWSLKNQQTMTQAERKEHDKRVNRQRKKAAPERERAYAQAAEKARIELSGMADCVEHQYLADKGVKPATGLKLSKSGELVIPIYGPAGGVISYQRIYKAENGFEKRFMAEGRTKGGWFKIPGSEVVCICEGLATGLSIHEATGYTVIIAFSGGNLINIARQAKSEKIVICADNDASRGDNPGLKYAKKAAQAINAPVAVPVMPEGVRGTDFNDLATISGLGAVRAIIDEALKGYEKNAIAGPAADWEPSVAEWPVMDESAFYGLAGDFVELACRNSEADPAATLGTFLVRFGVECGNAPTLYVGDTKHKARLASVIVGNSSKARKGTSGKSVARLYEALERPARFSPGPFSSGEGIIYAVRDAVKKWNERDKIEVVTDPGVEDKRLFILDEEFSGAMANTKREGNTLSTVIRSAWDTGNLDPLTKTCKTTATGAHVGWVSHITLNELNSRLDTTEAFNGFANRILWVCARRSKIVPWPEPMPDNELKIIRERLADALALTRENDFYQLKWSDAAKKAWIFQYYSNLTKDNPGLVGCVINRAEAQVIRLAMIYCLLDSLTTISILHLEAALAFWNYCEQSARYIFHGRQADQVAQRILDSMKSGPMTGTEIHRMFDSHVSKGKIEAALSELSTTDRVEHEKIKTKGRPLTLWKIKEPRVKSVISVISPADGQKEKLNTLNTLNTRGDTEIEVEI